MSAKKMCPYGNCKELYSNGGCKEASREISFNIAKQHYDLCPGTQGAKRIVRVCEKPDCETTNQLMADYCRNCGSLLRSRWDRVGFMKFFWSVGAEAPVSTLYYEVPQLVLHGDLLISSQGGDFVFTTISAGETLLKKPNPGPAVFSATPVAIKDRVYSCSPGKMWEFSIVKGEEQLTSLGVFQPSESARAIHVPYNRSDWIVMPGKVQGDGRAEILVFDTVTHRFKLPRLKLNPSDSILTPLHYTRGVVLFGTRCGNIFELRHVGPDPLDWGVYKTKFNAGDVLPKRRYLSAPALDRQRGCVYFELVDAETGKRGMLIIEEDNPKTIPLGDPAETCDQDELRLLVFPPVVCGGHAVTRSSAPSTCHFVVPALNTMVSVGNLLMDPVAVCGGGKRIVTVFGGNAQAFNAQPNPQAVSSVGIRALDGAAVVNRPVYYLGKIFIQTMKSLVGWEVP